MNECSTCVINNINTERKDISVKEGIILYSTNCPKCKVLATNLNQKGIVFTENTDTEEMLSLGIMSVPVLSVNGELYEFTEAINWINNRGV